MHDDSPGGIAIKDRTLAFWKDPNNFPVNPPRRVQRRTVKRERLKGFGFALMLNNIGLF